MIRQGLTRIRFETALTNRVEFERVSIDLAADTNSNVFPYWALWETSAAAGAGAVSAAPL
jgi:hypothetical protein